MGITVEEYEEIFSRMFGEEVLYEDVMDSKYLTIGENDIIYREDSNGFWVNYEYGVNEYFFENSFGYWFKKMYDTNGNEIYYEDSLGEIIDNRNKSNINESIEDYYDKIVNILEVPYFQNLETMGIDEDHYKLIFEKLFNQPVSVGNYDVLNSNRKELYFETSDGYWRKTEYDINGKIIYHENSEGFWVKREYDDNGNVIYLENSEGYWVKWEYDDNGNEIYFENSNGEIIDRRNNGNLNESVDYYDKIVNILEKPYFKNLETMGIDRNQYETILSKLFGQPVYIDNRGVFDSNENEIYYENSNGRWVKREYDENGNQIFSENSNGYWIRYEYNKNGVITVTEDSDGVLIVY
jgi:hypothetical protein